MRISDAAIALIRAFRSDDLQEADSPLNGTGKISPFDAHGQFRNALASDAGIACDGSAQAQRLVAILTAAANLGSDPRGIFLKFTLPPAAPAADTILGYIGSANNGVGASSLAWGIKTTGTLFFRLYGTNATDYRETTVANVLTDYGVNRDVIVQFGGDSAGRDCRINGLEATLTADTTVNTNGTAPANWQAAITCTYWVWEGAARVTLRKFWPANFRPSLNDAQDSFFLGGDAPWKYRWGTQSVYISDFSAGVNGWSDLAGNTTVAGNIDTAADGAGQPPSDNWLRLTKTATDAMLVSPGDLGLLFGRRYRINADAFAPAGTSVGYVQFSQSNFGAGYAKSDFSPGAALAITAGATTALMQEFLNSATNQTGYLHLRACNAAGAGANVTNGDKFYLKNVLVKQLGAVFFFSPGATGDGCGYQLHDAGTSGIDATVPVSGWTWTHPQRRGSVRTPAGGLSWNGTHEAKSWLGQRALPDGAVITVLTDIPSANTTGTGTSHGTTGSATRWVAAAARTNTKAVRTLANQMAATATDNDRDLTTTPDSNNFTGTIRAEAHYIITEGTP